MSVPAPSATLTQGVAWFDMHTCVVGIDRTRMDPDIDPYDVTAMDWALGPRRIDHADQRISGSTVQVKGATRLPEPAGALISQYPNLHGSTLRSYRDESGRTTLISGAAASAVLHDGGDSVVTVAPELETGPLSDLMLIALDHAVTAHDQALCHAACINLPANEGCILLHAPSGTGKSTTASAMTAFGLRISGDDTAGLLAGAEAAPVRAWGLPRGVRLHRRAVEFLPAMKTFIDPDAWDTENEQLINRKRLLEAGLIVDVPPVPVIGVFALSRGEKGATRIDKSTPFDGMRDLLADNITANEHGFFAGHEKRMDIYSALVADVPCYRVTIGDDPLDVARAIAQTLRITA